MPLESQSIIQPEQPSKLCVRIKKCSVLRVLPCLTLQSLTIASSLNRDLYPKIDKSLKIMGA